MFTIDLPNVPWWAWLVLGVSHVVTAVIVRRRPQNLNGIESQSSEVSQRRNEMELYKQQLGKGGSVEVDESAGKITVRAAESLPEDGIQVDLGITLDTKVLLLAIAAGNASNPLLVSALNTAAGLVGSLPA